ncbi:MAG: hypothetical protein Q9P14_06815 [candidate division KSB1 bacterium]|nr:hypothetical protein [candidate division KSB1 bacterium]
MQDNAMDFLGAGQPQVLPGLAAIQAFVQAVAHAAAVARVTLTGAHPDNVRVGLKHRHRADGRHRLVVEQRLPSDPAVGGFPQAAGCGADIDDIRIAHHPFHSRHAAAHARRPDGTGFHAFKQLGIELSKDSGGQEQKQKQRGHGPLPHTAVLFHDSLLFGLDGFNQAAFTTLLINIVSKHRINAGR